MTQDGDEGVQPRGRPTWYPVWVLVPLLALHGPSLHHPPLTSLQIHFDADFFQSGDLIEGSLRLRVAHELLVRNIRLFFYGEVLYWTRASSHHVHVYTFGRRFSELWRGAPDCYLTPGSYNYRFHIGTPKSLPSSFKSNVSEARIKELRYFCEARIEETNEDEHLRRREVEIRAVCPRFPDATADPLGTVVAREMITVRNVLDASGSLGATLSTLKGFSRRDSSVFANVEVLNCFRRLSVELRLVERTRRVGSASVFETVISSRKLGTLATKEPFKRWLGVDVWLPDEGRVDVREESRLLSLGLFLQLRVRSEREGERDVQVRSVFSRRDLVLDVRLELLHPKQRPTHFLNNYSFSGAATL